MQKGILNTTSFLIYTFFWIVFFRSLVFPQDTDWIDFGIELTINNKFAKALDHFQQQIDKRPFDYKSHFYLAATLNAKMTHFENRIGEARFKITIRKVMELADSCLQNEDKINSSQKATVLSYLGSAYGYQAYHDGQVGNWYSAISNGINSAKYLNQAIEIDSTMYDAYLGIGTYKYWRYSKLQFISWLPFIPDEREEGIEMIKNAISKSRYSKYTAMHQLIYILLDYGKTNEAIIYAEKIMEKYPHSQFMWWAAAHAFFKHRDYRRAELAYLHLYQLLESDKNVNTSHLLNCMFKLAFIYMEIGSYSDCYNQCNKIISLAEMKRIPEKDMDKLDEAREMLIECGKNLSGGTDK